MSFFTGWPGLGGVVLTNAVLATVLACVAAGVERRGWRASWVHAVWLVVILRFLAPPLVPWAVLPTGLAVMGDDERRPVVESVAVLSETGRRLPVVPASLTVPEIEEPLLGAPPVSHASPVHHWMDRYRTHGGPSLLLLLWAALSVVLLISALRRVALFSKLASGGMPAGESLQRRTEELAESVALRKVPEIRLVEDRRLGSPMILAAWKAPQMLLPTSLVDDLEPSELDTVLVHELAHLRRRDHWVRWPELLASVIFWWHPVVWWARRSLRRVEERCVDEWVLRCLPGRGRDYAEALLKTLELDADSPYRTPALASGIETMTSMESRLTMILKYRENASDSSRTTTWRRWAALPLLLLILAVLPTWARPGGDESPGHNDPLVDHEHYGDFEDAEAHRQAHLAEEAQHRREISHRRQELEDRRRDLTRELEQRRAEARRQRAELQRELEVLEARGDLDAGAKKEQERMRQRRAMLEEHLELAAAQAERESLAMDLETLALEAETAYLEKDLARAEKLAERQLAQERLLHEQTARVLQREAESHRKELQQQLEWHAEKRQELLKAGEAAEVARLEHQMERLQLEQQRAVAEQELMQRRLALEAERRRVESSVEASRQRMTSKQAAERAAAAASLEAEQRRLEAEHRQLENGAVRAEVRLRLDEIRNELPIQIQELRRVLDDVGRDGEALDEAALEEDRALKAELERLHQELGEVLGGQ